MRTTAVIHKAHSYFRVTDFNKEFEFKVLRPFCKRHLYKFALMQVKPPPAKKQWKVTHVFARTNIRGNEYRLPHSLVDSLLEFATSVGFNKSRIRIREEREITGEKVKFNLRKEFSKPRPNQKEWIDYQLSEGPIKANNANTGEGKTYMSLYTMTKLGVRTLITIQPRYITTWLNDIEKTMEGLDKDDILLWENTDINKLGKLIKAGKINPKIIILPLTRISGYLKRMKESKSVRCLGKVFKDMNCGFRIIDEGHESFHEVTMSMFYGNPKKTLLLSATLESDDQMTDKMYKTMIPFNYRLKEAEAEHYINVIAYLYRVSQQRYRIKTKQFGSYSDIAFESSILKSRELTEFYFQLMKKAFEEYYLANREEGMKCLFFFTLVKMCLWMKDRFRKEYPGEDFDTFLGMDKKTPTKYLEHEIVITTPGSCGTGKDIPGLMTVICSHTVFSSPRNKQMIGRLRNPRDKFGGRVDPVFIFPVCLDIDKHVDCMKKRRVAYAKKAKSFKSIDSFMELS